MTLAMTEQNKKSIRKNRKGFTLIELLVVVMLLTVLMLTAFPAFRGLERSTNRHRAVAEADALAQAALAYRRVYGQWPLEDRAEAVDPSATAIIAGKKDTTDQNTKYVTPCHLDIAKVVAVLRNATLADANGTDPNPRRMIFLELPDDRLDTTDGAVGTPLDPWGQPYVLVMSRITADNTVAYIEGGHNTRVTNNLSRAIAAIDGPEDAAALSWGDPASTNAVLFSWSKR